MTDHMPTTDTLDLPADAVRICALIAQGDHEGADAIAGGNPLPVMTALVMLQVVTGCLRAQDLRLDHHAVAIALQAYLADHND